MTGADASRRRAVGPAFAIGWDGSRDSGRDAFYDHLLQVCLLLLLRESTSTVAEVRDRLRPLGFEQASAAVRAALDELSDAGLALRAGDGGAAPMYSVTPAGRAWLRGATKDLRRTEVVLGGFLARCGERVLSMN